jgi:hypothetical protein
LRYGALRALLDLLATLALRALLDLLATLALRVLRALQVLRALLGVAGNSGTSGWSEQNRKEPDLPGILCYPIQTKLNIVCIKPRDASIGKAVHNLPREFHVLLRAKGKSVTLW